MLDSASLNSWLSHCQSVWLNESRFISFTRLATAKLVEKIDGLAGKASNGIAVEDEEELAKAKRMTC